MFEIKKENDDMHQILNIMKGISSDITEIDKIIGVAEGKTDDYITIRSDSRGLLYEGIGNSIALEQEDKGIILKYLKELKESRIKKLLDYKKELDESYDWEY